MVKKQLFHLAAAGNGRPVIGLRVLPVDARIGGYAVPRCTFSIYDYPDPGDPAVVAVDTVTSDLMLTDLSQVTPSCQVIDLRTASPLDREGVAAMASATAGAVLVDEATGPCSLVRDLGFHLVSTGAVTLDRNGTDLGASPALMTGRGQPGVSVSEAH